MSPLDFFRHAIERYEGRFPVGPIYQDLRIKGVGRDELLNVAKHYEGKEIEIDGSIYKLTGPGLEGFKGSRQLIKISSATEGDTGDDSDNDTGPTPGTDLAAFQPVTISAETTSPASPVSGPSAP
jgi:hypothetical protein